jgi:hypothetical protein
MEMLGWLKKTVKLNLRKEQEEEDKQVSSASARDSRDIDEEKKEGSPSRSG